MDILIASQNQDKIAEIRAIFRLPEVGLRSLDEFPGAPAVSEDGNTLYQNALKKAQVLAEFSDLPTIADDTGLEVDALAGAPGVFAARYAGENATYEDNIEKLLYNMKNIALPERSARFRTVALFYRPNQIISATGSVEGMILTHKRGQGGFGYDPVFQVKETGQTFAEMNPEEKNRISHRGQAFHKLYQKLYKELFPVKYE